MREDPNTVCPQWDETCLLSWETKVLILGLVTLCLILCYVMSSVVQLGGRGSGPGQPSCPLRTTLH